MDFVNESLIFPCTFWLKFTWNASDALCCWTGAGKVVGGPVPKRGTSGILAGIICWGEGLPIPPELAFDMTSDVGEEETPALGVTLLAAEDIFDCTFAGTAGGGGIVPTTGDDIMGGTMGITFGVGGGAVVVFAPIAAGLAISWLCLQILLFDRRQTITLRVHHLRVWY